MAREQQQEQAASRVPGDQVAGYQVPAARPGQDYAGVADYQPAQHQESAADTHARLSHRLARSPFGSFIPWILFWVIGGPSTWETASIAALLAAALDAATVVFFAALVVVSLLTSRHDVNQLDKYSQALSSGALGLIALGSIVFGHPFTVDTPRSRRHRRSGTARCSSTSTSC
jgi:hypothetical protein